MKNLIQYIFLIFSLLSLPSYAQTPSEIIGNYKVKPDMTSPSDKSVGGVPVSFDVLQTGAATLSIPIECPKGVNGMQPNISIGYNSLSGDGFAGWGCSIHGFSAITRGVKTVYYDGAANGRDFSENDALYLDGKRLVQKYGNGIVNGATFVSESDPYSVFTVCGSGSEMWICGKLSNGNTVWYGHDIDGRQFATIPSGVTVVNAWYLKYVEDRNGNTIEIMYKRDNGTVYPWHISYGANVKCNVEHCMSVTFSYEPRDFSIPYTINGVACTNRLRLKSIETSSNGKPYRKYSLDYETNQTTHKEKLGSVSVTPGSMTEERKINMTWDGQTSNGISARTVDVPETDYFLTEKLNRYFTAVDINGDGISDILEFAPVKITTSYGANSSSGVLDNYCIPYLSCIDDNGNVKYIIQNHISLGGDINFDGFTDSMGVPVFTDMNGDGIQDVIIPDIRIIKSSNVKEVFFYTLYGKRADYVDNDKDRIDLPLVNTDKFPLYIAADLDADGRGEIITLERNCNKQGKYVLTDMPYVKRGGTSDYSRAGIKLKSAPQNLLTGDFNNDGLTDLLVLENGCSELILNDGGRKPYDGDQHRIVYNQNVKDANMVETGDFNGDGCLDIAMFSDKKLVIALGDGKGNFTLCSPQTFENLDSYAFRNSESKMFAYDFNRDGKSDLVIAKANMSHHKNFIDTRTFWLASQGSAFSLQSMAVSKKRDDAKSQRYVIGDFNGDGYMDLLNYGNQCYDAVGVSEEPKFYIYSEYAAPSEDRVVHVDNGFDTDVAISYANSILPEICKPKSDAVFPVRDCVVPISVVSNVKKNTGITGVHKTTFRYEGLKAHAQGRGILGFSKFTATDTETGSVKETEIRGYGNDSFLPKQIKTTEATGNVTTVTETENMIVSVVGKSFLSYPQSVVETDIEGNVTKMECIYDKDRGYLTEKKTTNDDGSYVKTILGGYGCYSGEWMPKTSTTVMKHPDDSQEYTDVTKMEYDGYGNVTSTVSHAATDKETATDMTYDNFGNITSVFSKAGSLQTSTAYTEYGKDGRFAVHTYTEPVSTDFTYTYDDFGNLLTETDNTDTTSPLITTHVIDAWGREVGAVYPTGKVSGILTKWKDLTEKSYFTVSYSNDAPWTKTEYDRLGREFRRETVNVGDVPVTTATEYDKKGNVVSVVIHTGELSTSKSMAYDDSGRLLSETYSSGKAVNYTYGKRKVTINTNGHSFEKEYDSWGNVKKSTDTAATMEYEYYSNGKTKKATCCGVSTDMEYDAAGNRILLKDADAGKRTSEYDALGRITIQEDEQGNVICKSYDRLGRVTSESGVANSVNYSYNVRGQMTSAYCGNNSTSIAYDKFGRKTKELRNPEFGETQISEYKYNDVGQVYEETLPGNIKVGYGYDSYGNLVSRSIGGVEVWKLLSHNGKTLRYALLGGKLENVTKRDKNGYMSTNNLYFGGKNIDWISYSFNPITGNLSKKSRKGEAFIKSFSYDAMDRLTGCVSIAQIVITDTTLTPKPYFGNSLQQNSIGVVLPGDKYPTTIGDKYVYEDNGNILSTTAIGNYTYDDDCPHAVKTVENKSGSIHSASQQVVYNNLNLVDGIMEGDRDDMTDIEYYFGTDNSRWHAKYFRGHNIYRTIDYGNGYEKVTENDTIREFWYLGDDILLYRENGGTVKAFYMLTDNVGSIVGIYDSDGQELFRADYDPWGVMTVRRNDIGFIRGYTGHEMLQEFNLINMNGRVYDPQICRFLSPDNYVQEPVNSQSFNRYSYCLNNPLKYNDPSGELFTIDDIFICAFMSGAINWAMNGGQLNAKGLAFFGIGTGSFVAGSLVGAGISSALYTSSLGSGFISGAAIGLGSGFAGGFTSGLGNSLVSGCSFSSSLSNAFSSGLQSGILGAIIGGLADGTDALEAHANFFTGRGSLEIDKAFACSGNSTRLEDLYEYGKKKTDMKYVGKFEGVPVFESSKLGNVKGNYMGVTLPPTGIFVGSGVYANDKSMMWHEFGHMLQSFKHGLKAYYRVIAPESLIDALVTNESGHLVCWTETYANFLSKNYMLSKYPKMKWSNYYPVKDIDWFNNLRLNMANSLY